MKQYQSIIVVSVVCLFLLSGCDSVEKILKPKKETVINNTKGIEGPLLAQVNNWKIGLGDFEKRLQTLEPLAKQQNLDVNDYEFKKRVLDELVKAVLLSEEAKSQGFDKKSDVQEALEGYKQTLLAQSLIADTVKNMDVTDVEITNFYSQNKDYFKSPEEVRVKEIAVNSDSEAKDLYIRILQGEDFSLLASQHSVSSSKDNGGDLGYIVYDEKEKFYKFWEIVTALEKGEISSIFKGEDKNYYIVKLEDRKEGKATPLVEIKEEIRRVLKIDKENKGIDNLVNTSKQNAKVIINEDLLQ